MRIYLRVSHKLNVYSYNRSLFIQNYICNDKNIMLKNLNKTNKSFLYHNNVRSYNQKVQLTETSQKEKEQKNERPNMGEVSPIRKLLRYKEISESDLKVDSLFLVQFHHFGTSRKLKN